MLPMRQQDQNHSFWLKARASQTVEIDLKADCLLFLLMTILSFVGKMPALF
jgi:hypothetical protein